MSRRQQCWGKRSEPGPPTTGSETAHNENCHDHQPDDPKRRCSCVSIRPPADPLKKMASPSAPDETDPAQEGRAQKLAGRLRGRLLLQSLAGPGPGLRAEAETLSLHVSARTRTGCAAEQLAPAADRRRHRPSGRGHPSSVVHHGAAPQRHDLFGTPRRPRTRPPTGPAGGKQRIPPAA